jgi:hypothetical protein
MDDQFEKYNGGRTLHRGAEVEVGVSDKSDHVSWKASYTYQAHQFSEFNDGGIDYGGKALPGVPTHHLWQQLTLNETGNISFDLVHHFVSEVWLDDANTLHGPGYHLMNLTGQYVFYPGANKSRNDQDPGTTHAKWKWIISGHIHNLWNVHYASMFQINAPGAVPRYYYPGKPRSGYFSIGFEYGL